jgi:hypothetical protein
MPTDNAFVRSRETLASPSEPFTPFASLVTFFSNSLTILKYLFLDGSLNIDWQRDCVVISRTPSAFRT